MRRLMRITPSPANLLSGPDGICEVQARLGGGARIVRRQPLSGDYLYLQGLSGEMAEALADTSTSASAANWGFPPKRRATPRRCLTKVATAADIPPAANFLTRSGSCRSCADEVGINLTEEDQLDPEQSISAIVVHHPQAKDFSA
jgi:5-methyltetrahydrofolate--homocysteine methyltransferase